MRRIQAMFPFRLSTALLLIVSACADDAGEMSPDSATQQEESRSYKAPKTTYPCNIQTLVETHCVECHGDSPANGAPMPLVRRTDFMAFGPNTRDQLVGHLAVLRMRDRANPMPPYPRPAVPAGDVDALEGWFGDGRNPWHGNSCDDDSGGAGGGSASLACTDPPLFLRQSCGTANCHNTDTPQVGLDLDSPGVEERLLDTTAVGVHCAGEPLAPSEDPASGLFLDKLGPSPRCGSSMPPTGQLSEEEMACLRQWVEGLQ